MQAQLIRVLCGWQALSLPHRTGGYQRFLARAFTCIDIIIGNQNLNLSAAC